MSAIPTDYQQACDSVAKQSKCYDNCLTLAHTLDARYILGVCDLGGYAIPHAWLYREGAYFDPTICSKDKAWELKYYSLVEIEPDSLIDVILEIENRTGKPPIAPMLETVAHHPFWEGLFTEAGKRRINFLF